MRGKCCSILQSSANTSTIWQPGVNSFPDRRDGRHCAKQALADGILDLTILCAYETARPEDKRWSGWTGGQMRKGHLGLAAVELDDLSGPLTIGHIAIGCIFGYLDLRFPEDGWRHRHPKLAAWSEAFEQLPSMQAARPPAG